MNEKGVALPCKSAIAEGPSPRSQKKQLNNERPRARRGPPTELDGKGCNMKLNEKAETFFTVTDCHHGCREDMKSSFPKNHCLEG